MPWSVTINPSFAMFVKGGVDTQAPFGNGYLLPRGTLREPVSSRARADAVIVTRCHETAPPYYNHIARSITPRPIFEVCHKQLIRCIVPPMNPVDADALTQPLDKGAQDLPGRRIFAFSGLARNETFWKSIGDLGGHLQGRMGFEDHYPYHIKDIKTI